MEYDEFSAMNTTIQVAAEGKRSALEPGFRLVRAYVAEAEQRFSRFRPDSELSILNRAAGSWVQVSADMMALLKEALEMVDLTDGFFNPAVLGALKSIGYDRSMDDIRAQAVLPAMKDYTWMRPTFEGIRLDFDRRRSSSFRTTCKLIWVASPRAGLPNRLPGS